MPTSATTASETALDPIALNRENAARFIGVSPKTLANWASRGIGPRVTHLNGTRTVVYRVSDLKAFIDGRKG